MVKEELVINSKKFWYCKLFLYYRKYQKILQIKDCRFKAKALKLLEGKIGEGWDINRELINDIKDGTIM